MVDSSGSRILEEIETTDPGYYRIAISPDGKKLAYSTKTGLVVQNRNSNEIVFAHDLGKETGWAKDLTWEPIGKRLLVAQADGNYSLFAGEDGQLLHEWKSKRSGPHASACWHPQGNLIAMENSNQLLVVDANTADVVQEWSLEGTISALAWAPSGRTLATARQGDFLVEIAKDVLRTLGQGVQAIRRHIETYALKQ